MNHLIEFESVPEVEFASEWRNCVLRQYYNQHVDVGQQLGQSFCVKIYAYAHPSELQKRGGT